MYAVVGTSLTALTVLGFTVMVLATRKPGSPAWISYTLTHQFVVISAISLGGLGIALVVRSIALIKQQPLTVTHVILIVSILVAFFVAWKRLRVRRTLVEYARQKESLAQATEPVSRPGLVPDIAGTSSGSGTATPEDPTPTRPRTPRWPKKAA
jgi:hypothetical protein